MQFVDAATVSGTRRTTDGYLVADVRTARTGIQVYLGTEVGRLDMDVVRVWRPETEVFSRDSLATYAHKPVTLEHPTEHVTADNWKALAVGQIGDEVVRDGEFIRVPLVVMDAAAISAIEGGKRELSAGYDCDLSFEAGHTPAGKAYDAIQRGIRINHVAIVDSARAGPMARIGDGASIWGISPVPLPTRKEAGMAELRKILVDGLQVETTDAGAAAIEKLTKDKEAAIQGRQSAETLIADADKAHKAAIARKDEEIGTLKADIQKLKDAAIKPEDLDRMVADRAALAAVVKTIDSAIEIKGSGADLRRAAVRSKLGDDLVRDASDAEVSGMFKAIARDAKGADPIRDAARGGFRSASDAASAADAAWQSSVNDLNSWRNKG